MFRRIILTAFLGTGLTAGLAMTPASADAHPPVERFRHEERFLPVERYHHVERCYPRIEVECLRHGCWECYGSYYDRCEAEHVASHIRYEGLAARIRD